VRKILRTSNWEDKRARKYWLIFPRVYRWSIMSREKESLARKSDCIMNHIYSKTLYCFTKCWIWPVVHLSLHWWYFVKFKLQFMSISQFHFVKINSTFIIKLKFHEHMVYIPHHSLALSLYTDNKLWPLNFKMENYFNARPCKAYTISTIV